jgi:hypothetical protein
MKHNFINTGLHHFELGYDAFNILTCKKCGMLINTYQLNAYKDQECKPFKVKEKDDKTRL